MAIIFKKLLFKLVRGLSATPSNNKAIVLNYHRVSDENGSFFDDKLSASEFKEKMRFLKQNFTVVSISELMERKKNNTIEPLTVALTIDDGYEDGYSVILPILKELDIPATFFVATEGLELGGLWNDYISTAFNLSNKDKLENFLGFPSFDLTTVKLKQKAHKLVHERCKFLPLTQRSNAIEQLLTLLDVNVSLNEFMSRKQIEELHRSGMTIGAHTHSHPILSLENSEICFQEIKKSKELLEDIINEEVKYFAYPNGKINRDFNDSHKVMVKELNFSAAFMTDWGYLSSNTDSYGIPRFTPWDKDKYSFGIRLCNYFRK